MQNETLDTAIAAYASKTAYVGAGVTGAGWWLSNAFFGWVGVGIGLAGFGINWYYRAKADRRNQREYEARMRLLERGLYDEEARLRVTGGSRE